MYWYERDWTAERIDDLEAAGMRLPHFSTGRISALSADEDTIGEQIDLDRTTLLDHATLQSEQFFTFQYWIEVDHDVVCTVEKLAPDMVVQRFYLDGLTDNDVRFVVGVVIDQIRVSPLSARGLIVDRSGESGSEDWDELIAGAPGRISVRPNIVGLPREVAAQHPELQFGAPIHIGDLVIFDPDGLLPTRPGA